MNTRSLLKLTLMLIAFILLYRLFFVTKARDHVTQDSHLQIEPNTSGSELVDAYQKAGQRVDPDMLVHKVTGPAQVVVHAGRTDTKDIGSAIVIMVFSARDGFDKRAAIRSTWGKGYRNVLFFVGNACGLPNQHVKELTCQQISTPSRVEQEAYDHQVADEDRALSEEMKIYGDVVILPMVDTYKSLVRKLKEVYRWSVEHTNAKWFLKADDDCYIRVDKVEEEVPKWKDEGYIMRAKSFKKWPFVIKDKNSRYYEGDWKPTRYPPFPNGARVVNRALATWVRDHSERLFEYGGEDTSMGIWMKENLKVRLIKDRIFLHPEGDCSNPKKLIIGHKVTPEKMRKCYDEVDANRK